MTVSANASDNVGVTGVRSRTRTSEAEDLTRPTRFPGTAPAPRTAAPPVGTGRGHRAGNTATATSVGVLVDNQAPTGSVVINGGAAAPRTPSPQPSPGGDRCDQQRPERCASRTREARTRRPEAYATTKAWTLRRGCGRQGGLRPQGRPWQLVAAVDFHRLRSRRRRHSSQPGRHRHLVDPGEPLVECVHRQRRRHGIRCSQERRPGRHAVHPVPSRIQGGRPPRPIPTPSRGQAAGNPSPPSAPASVTTPALVNVAASSITASIQNSVEHRPPRTARWNARQHHLRLPPWTPLSPRVIPRSSPP